MRAAFESVAVALEGRARTPTTPAQQILKATALIARDKGLVKAADKQLAAGRGRATAISNAVEEYCAQFEALGGYFAERVTDLRDVGSRAVAAVLGVPAPGVPDFSEPSVVVAQDLAPAETATLDRSLVVGIITEAGGRTATPRSSPPSWASRPSCSSPGATGIPAGTPVALDGDTGEVTIAPDSRSSTAQRERPQSAPRRSRASSRPRAHPRRRRRGAARQHRRRAGRRGRRRPGPRGRRAVPHRVRLPLGRPRPRPSRSRPRSTAGSSRRSGAGASSSARWTPAPTSRWRSPTSGPEENPALGRRGLRLSAERPELLDAQLEALAVAARDTGADVRVMAPMVATAEEAAWFARRVRENGLPKAGVMIEVPGCGAAGRARARARSTSAASAPTTWRSTRWPPTGCRAS